MCLGGKNKLLLWGDVLRSFLGTEKLLCGVQFMYTLQHAASLTFNTARNTCIVQYGACSL